MIRLLCILPYPGLQRIMDKLVCRIEEQGRVRVYTHVATADQLAELPLADCEAMIGRGYTARKLKERNPTVPVIEINISGYDVIWAIQECRQHFQPEKIAIIGFYDALRGIKELALMWGGVLEVYVPREHDDIQATLEQALADGCDAVIGGYTVVLAAQQRGINAMLIRSREEAVYMALEEAVRAVRLLREEHIRTMMYKTVIRNSKDGIIYVDATGIIRIANQVAHKFGHLHLEGQSLNEAFPFLYCGMQKALQTGDELAGEVHQCGKSAISVSYNPVTVQGEYVGAVITMQDISRVQRLEEQIRKKLSGKGLRARYTFADIIHTSAEIDQTIRTAGRFAATASNVLLVGETGTGKELFAQGIHHASSRCNGPFVAINCAALPENLLESELFGYSEGAFTSAVKGGKPGLFELAHNGTLFLDEIAEIPLSLQSKLLRVLQEREVRKIGDSKVITVNVRILSATNKNLENLASNGLFRRDLLYRLNVLKLVVPPLRRRRSDIAVLFRHFWEAYCGEYCGSKAAMPRLPAAIVRDYPFWGNVRELQNVVERAVVLCAGQTELRAADLADILYPDGASISADISGRQPALTAFAMETAPASIVPPVLSGDMVAPHSEEDQLLQAIERCHGNKSQAARLLGMDRTTLWRKLHRRHV